MTRNSLIYINIVNTLYSSGEEDLNKIESIYLSVGPKPNLTLAGNLYTDIYALSMTGLIWVHIRIREVGLDQQHNGWKWIISLNQCTKCNNMHGYIRLWLWGLAIREYQKLVRYLGQLAACDLLLYESVRRL